MQTDLQKEQQLLLNAQQDSAKFGELYQYLAPHVYRFAYSIAGTSHDAEDITSSTFIEFYNKYHKSTWRGISMRYWLFRTARNYAYRLARYTSRMTEEIEDAVDEPEISFVDEIMHKDIVDRVKEEILTLKPNEQETINLRVWEDLEFHDIAELQGEKLATVRKRFYRSVEKIKKSLQQKKIYTTLLYPILFTAISRAGCAKEYALPASLHYFTPGVAGTFTMIKTYLTSNIGIAILTGLIVLVGAIAGISND
jgi:RNA polymerase sigma factor (sigma-70 family)